MIRPGRYWQYAGAVIISLWLPVCFGQDQVELLIPQQGFYKPSDPMIFRVPANLSAKVLQRLSMELDGIDVTSFISREGGRAAFNPPQPLSYGFHQVRLVEYLPDGNIVERALYNVEVRKNALFRQADASADINLSVMHRLKDRNVSESIGKTQQNGGATLSTRMADGGWQAGADMQLIYNSQSDQMTNGRRFDLANGLVSASQGAVTVRAGDQSVPGSNLVLNGFARRGISGNVRLDGLRSEFTGFALRTTPVSGFAHWPGASDGTIRTDGIVWSTSPLTQNPERLQIVATYLNGEGNPQGNSVIGFDEAVTNHASSLVVDSLTWDQRLRLRGEYARSSTDFDASAPTSGETSDNAMDLLAVYSHLQQDLLGSAFNWNVGAQRKRVGLYFYSLGNIGQTGDKMLDQVFGGFNWGGWATSGQIAREFDNIDDDPRFPHLHTNMTGLQTQYSPLEMTQPTGLMSLFAQPTLIFAESHTTRKHKDIPLSYAGDRIDDTTDALSVTLQFVPGLWNWDITRSQSRIEDTANIQPDQQQDATELNLNLPLSENLTLTSMLRYDRSKDLDSGISTNESQDNVTLNLYALENRLNMDMAYTHYRQSAINTGDDTYHTITAGVSWIAIQAQPNRPGLTLLANGSSQSNNHMYQIFVGLRVNLQANY